MSYEIMIDEKDINRGVIKFNGRASKGNYFVINDDGIEIKVSGALKKAIDSGDISIADIENEIIDKNYEVWRDKLISENSNCVIGIKEDGTAVVFDAEDNDENREKIIKEKEKHGIVELLNR